MMSTNLFVIANVKQLRTGGSFRILLPFFRTSWGVGVLNWAIFNSFQNRVEFGTILEGLRNFGGRGRFDPPTLPRYATHYIYLMLWLMCLDVWGLNGGEKCWSVRRLVHGERKKTTVIKLTQFAMFTLKIPSRWTAGVLGNSRICVPFPTRRLAVLKDYFRNLFTISS